MDAREWEGMTTSERPIGAGLLYTAKAGTISHRTVRSLGYQVDHPRFEYLGNTTSGFKAEKVGRR